MITLTLLNGMKLSICPYKVVEVTEGQSSSFVKMAYPTETVSYEVKEKACEVEKMITHST